MTDAELIDRHLSGDRAALGEILDRFEAPLLRFARALTGSDDLAQDAVQETFLKLVREGGKMREVRALLPWLLHVGRNCCLDQRRREVRMERKHEESVRGAALVASAPADEAVIHAETRDRVREAVERLPEPQRAVVKLKMWEGLTYREIADRLGMTLTNVSYHLGRAVASLSGVLKGVEAVH